ncbi:uncharacterized protein RSE6_10539 [Rhynchosporium secalis]|uniref:Uncharacterized protein n=1 Tax=Rhynchosporium secalis TaxID=38038 RepID=A0A1E1MKP6_RHYSE|nr:uncharacterized protein RSE6_10539 [Rhynchosporium secalis]
MLSGKIGKLHANVLPPKGPDPVLDILVANLYRGQETITKDSIPHPKEGRIIRNSLGMSTSVMPQATQHLSTPHCVDQGFITKSRWLRAYLTRSLNAALSQIEQWYPDDGGDEMDWQPDSTTVFKQLPGPTCICGELSRSAGNSLPQTAGEDVLQAQCLLEETQSGGFDGGSPAMDCRNESFSMKRSSGFSDTVGTVSDDVQRRDVSL